MPMSLEGKAQFRRGKLGEATPEHSEEQAMKHNVALRTACEKCGSKADLDKRTLIQKHVWLP